MTAGPVTILLTTLPYARALGVEGEVGDDGALYRLPFKPELIGNPRLPALHGGAVASFAEIAAMLELRLSGRVQTLSTIGVTIEYLRRAKAVDMFARARVQRLGRRVANVRAWAWQEDEAKPIALLYGRFSIGTGAGAD